LSQMDAVNERELIESFLGGEQWAFEKLMSLHQERIYRVARGLLGDHDRAADVTQEAFIRAFGSLKDFQFRSSFGTWLTRIALNLCFSQLRKDRLRRTLSLSDLAERLSTSRERPDRVLGRKDLAASIERALAGLPPKQRAVFLLRHYEELPYAQIADVMGRSEGAVRANYHQAVQKLRRSLEESDDEEA